MIDLKVEAKETSNDTIKVTTIGKIEGKARFIERELVALIEAVDETDEDVCRHAIAEFLARKFVKDMKDNDED